MKRFIRRKILDAQGIYHSFIGGLLHGMAEKLERRGAPGDEISALVLRSRAAEHDLRAMETIR